MDTHKRFTKMEAIVHNFQKLSFTTASIIFNDCFVTMNYYLFFINTPQQPQCYLILDISFILMLISNAVVVFLNLYFQFLSLVSHLPFFIKFPACPKKKNLYPFSLLAVHLHINLLCSLPRLIHISKYVKIFMKKINFSK